MNSLNKEILQKLKECDVDQKAIDIFDEHLTKILGKVNSRYVKDLNNCHKKIHKLYKIVEKRKNFSRVANSYLDILLADGRTSKEELSNYFKRNNNE